MKQHFDFRVGQCAGGVFHPRLRRVDPRAQEVVWGGGGNAAERGTKSEVAHKWADWLHDPCRLGGGGGGCNALERGTQSKGAHKWADWLHNPCRLRGPQLLIARRSVRSGPQVDVLATWPLLSEGGGGTPQSGGQNQQWPKWEDWLQDPCRLGGGSPTPQCRGHSQKWPTSGQIGYVTPAV